MGESTLKIAKLRGCLENPFVNDTSLVPRPLPSLHMRRHYSALSVVRKKWRNSRRNILLVSRRAIV